MKWNHYINESLKTSHQLVIENLWQIARVNLLFVTLFLATNYLGALLARYLFWNRIYQSFTLALLVLPFYTWLTSGLVVFYRRLVEKQPLSVLILFNQYRHFFPIFLYNLGVFLLYMVSIDILVEFNEYPVIIQVRMVIGTALFFILVGRSIFTIPLIMEGFSFIQAIRRSFLLSRPAPILFVMTVCFYILTGTAGIAFFGIGFLYSLGISMTAALVLFKAHKDELNTAVETE